MSGGSVGRTRLASLAAAATVLAATLLFVTPAGAAQAQKVWSGSAVFLSGSGTDTAVSSTGQLMLASHAASWTRFVGNPVLTPSQSWDSQWVWEPDVLYDGGVYKMWYAGCAQTCDIGYATSSDGTTWAPYSGNPVVAADASSWDTYLENPHVIHDGTLYRMWYAANGPLSLRIGYATSPDGVHWTKYGTWPIFNGTMAWDAAAVTGPAVVQVGSTFVLYFSGQSGNYVYNMGRATSTDGVHFTEYAGNPVFVPQAAWEQSRLFASWVAYGPSGYDAYYSAGDPGSPCGIGHVISVDGVQWTRDPANPVLTVGATGTWDGSVVGAPYLATVGGQVRLYYTGYNQSILQIGYAIEGGTAYASLGTWASPVFDAGDPNTTWSSLAWSAITPPGTAVGASLQVGNVSTPGFTWTLSPPSVNTPVSLSLPKARYARVIIALATQNVSRTPAVASIQVTYESPGSAPSEFWGLGPLGFALLLLFVAAGMAIAAVAWVASRRRSPPASSNPLQAGAVCPRCGAPTRDGQAYCDSCGQRLAPP